MEAHRLAGDIDYILKVRVPNARAYDAFYRALIKEVSIFNVTSALSMEEIKNTTALPVAAGQGAMPARSRRADAPAVLHAAGHDEERDRDDASPRSPPTTASAPQIAPGDVAEIAARGFKSIMCNRPDGEDPGQTAGRGDPRRGRAARASPSPSCR